MANGHGGRRARSGRKPNAIRTIRRQALQDAGPDAERALAFIIGIMDDPSQSVRIRKECAIEAMDRVWGKSTQKQQIEGKLDIGLENAAKEFDKLIARLVATRSTPADSEGPSGGGDQ